MSSPPHPGHPPSSRAAAASEPATFQGRPRAAGQDGKTGGGMSPAPAASPPGARKATSPSRRGPAASTPHPGAGPGTPAQELDVLLPPWQGAAAAILRNGLWCGIEVCISVPAQIWEPRLVIFLDSVAGIADAVTGWIDDFPGCDARISGYSRAGLRRIDDAPAALCHIASSAPSRQANG